MSDYKKIRLIHEIDATFTNISPEIVNTLKSQIIDKEKQINLERFFSGYSTEDTFYYIYSALPWIKLIHPLSQEQVPFESKKEFQVPDFMVYIETSKNESMPLLIEVKGVKKKRSTLSLPQIQFENLANYARVMNIPLLFAIYWQTYHIWTINDMEIFLKKTSCYKLDIDTSIQNDLSVIFGDFTFIVPPHLQRAMTFDKNKQDNNPIKHKEYGGLVEELITWDVKKLYQINSNESMLLRSFMNMGRNKIEQEGNITKMLYISSEQYLPKFTYLIIRLLSKAKENLSEINCSYAIQIVYNLFEEKLKLFKIFYMPKTRNNAHDAIMKQAFAETDVLDVYLSKSINI